MMWRISVSGDEKRRLPTLSRWLLILPSAILGLAGSTSITDHAVQTDAIAA